MYINVSLESFAANVSDLTSFGTTLFSERMPWSAIVGCCAAVPLLGDGSQIHQSQWGHHKPQKKHLKKNNVGPHRRKLVLSCSISLLN